jgi:hypothetical protein
MPLRVALDPRVANLPPDLLEYYVRIWDYRGTIVRPGSDWVLEFAPKGSRDQCDRLVTAGLLTTRDEWYRIADPTKT